MPVNHTSNHINAAVPSRALWAGRIIGGLAVLFLLFDCIIHILAIAPVVEAFTRLGYPPSLARTLGIIELLCVAAYVVPSTSILGAVLLTGYLGGAVATQVRVGGSLFGEILFPFYIAAMIWGALYLLEPRLRALVPLRR